MVSFRLKVRSSACLISILKEPFPKRAELIPPTCIQIHFSLGQVDAKLKSNVLLAIAQLDSRTLIYGHLL